MPRRPSPPPQPAQSGPVSFADVPELMPISVAARAVRTSDWVIRVAIRAGELAAFIPGKRATRTPGRGMGYRIHRADLEAWWFSRPELARTEKKEAAP